MTALGLLAQDLLLGSGIGIVHSAAVVGLVNTLVPEPYMDEQFHVGQTRRYCRGVYDQWDPMITTPPALYFLALLLGFCGRERLLNSLLVPICFAALCRLRRLQLGGGAEKSDQCWLIRVPALSVVLLPVLLDTSLLFYTDLLSLTTVILGLGSACPFHSFLAFTMALLTRQTNIVWAAFYCFPFAWEAATKFCSGELSSSRALIQLLRRCSLHLLLAMGFFCYILWNGGSIVLGDKSAHKPVFHPPQMLYFFAFTAASTLPLFIAHLLTNWRHMITKWPILLLFLLISSILALGSVHCCTLAHPYLLADNRHFTFYIWRRLFQRHWMVKYMLVPLYAFCATIMMEMATLTRTAIEKMAFLAATAICLVPAHLLEFRYFIVPFAIWRCAMVGPQPRWAQLAELCLHLMVNTMALYVFLERPFKWPSEPDKWQRFMW